MRCSDCGIQLTEITGDIELSSKQIGKYKVAQVTYFSCHHCGKILLPDEAWDIADREQKRILDKRIGEVPIDNFIVASDAEEILGVSRQAFHQNKRIQRGFIYSKKIGNVTLYDKKSVIDFKEKGDGRYLLDGKNTDSQYVILVTIDSSQHVRWKGEGMGVDFGNQETPRYNRCHA